jgi:hypothetical protein
MAKWALITGASAGIGEATALELSTKGFNLILVARRKDRLENLKKTLEAKGQIQVVMATLDVRKSEEIEQFARDHAETLQKVSVLINNAGLARGTDKVQAGKMADWDDMIDTNVKGLLAFTRAILPYFIANNHGHVINIGSVAGRWTYPGGAVYCATKFAVRAISEGLRMDLLGSQIRVTNIEPGMVETEFSKVRMQDEQKASQVYAGMKPLTAADIADTIGWVVARPAHVNIQELVIFPTDQASIRDVHRV